MAQEPDIDRGGDVFLSEFICSGKASKQQIEALAKMIVNNQVTKEVRTCYYQLTDEGKVDVFEAMARERGVSLEDPYKESREDLANTEGREDLANTENINQINGIHWNQLVEHAWLGSNLVSAGYYWPSLTYCDGDDTDVDWIFHFYFPSAVSNPNALRNISTTSLAVDIMLTYYQATIHGVKGIGNTASSMVQICVGDDGVSTVGGPGVIEDHMELGR